METFRPRHAAPPSGWASDPTARSSDQGDYERARREGAEVLAQAERFLRCSRRAR